MFESSNSVNVFNLERDLISINLGKIVIFTKNKDRYTGIYAICRLLSLEEIRRIDTIKNNSAIIQDSIEESIVKECLIDTLGLNKDDIDFEISDAGLISRIANAIIIKSLSMLSEPIRKVELLEKEISLIETMGAIVSKHMNISYIEVMKLPINKLLRYFSICKMTFPNEIKFGNNDNDESD
jgi:hypothetical protein